MGYHPGEGYTDSVLEGGCVISRPIPNGSNREVISYGKTSG